MIDGSTGVYAAWGNFTFWFWSWLGYNIHSDKVIASNFYVKKFLFTIVLKLQDLLIEVQTATHNGSSFDSWVTMDVTAEDNSSTIKHSFNTQILMDGIQQ